MPTRSRTPSGWDAREAAVALGSEEIAALSRDYVRVANNLSGIHGDMETLEALRRLLGFIPRLQAAERFRQRESGLRRAVGRRGGTAR